MTENAPGAGVENLAAAWAERRRAARADLVYAQTAPALFKPEWTERAVAEFSHAHAQVGYWLGIGHG